MDVILVHASIPRRSSAKFPTPLERKLKRNVAAWSMTATVKTIKI